MSRAGLRPKKSLGQNFLADERALARIADAAELTPQDTVLEIGPGLGTLTRHLAERAGRVVAVELDASLIPILHQTLAPYPNVEIIHRNALEFQISDACLSPTDPRLVEQRRPFSYKVVANIPYNITSQVVRHVLETEARPALVVLTIQREVAQRIVAEPGHLSLLAISVQLYGRPSIVGHIEAGAFYPPPQVDSAIVRIEPYARPSVDVPDTAHFFAVVKAGFAQRRKQLHNALAAGLARPPGEVADALERARVDGRRRAETLSLDEWARLAKELT